MTAPPQVDGDSIQSGGSSESLLRLRALFSRLRVARRLAARLKATWRRRKVLLAVSLLAAALLLFPAGWLIHHVYFDRAGIVAAREEAAKKGGRP